MTERTLYEEAMCCSTGVCGPDHDDELLEVSAALDQLEEAFDIEVSRANMQHDIDRFLETERIADLVDEHGPSILPITVLDDAGLARTDDERRDRHRSARGTRRSHDSVRGSIR
ncbi:arsenic metallochaperone ArsD family protein [Natrinema sp. DC36]|uniref:arsenite efflux transporter metallochaperone ArsD n=1 Tax=Natrinema sp. DC36 TaxID=2878680 RepID=UPI001CF0BC08|nr:arsenic metallochaperone ArsD family protein [Natrinema sp. DC36]